MMIKVAIVIPSLVQSGVFEVVKNIVTQSKNDPQVEMFLISLRNIQNYGNEEKMRELLGDHLIIIPGTEIISIKKYVRFWKVINKVKPNVIHFNAFESELYSLVILKHNLKFMSTAHNMGINDFVPTYGKIGYLMGIIQKIIYKRMDLIVGVSKTVLDYYRRMGFEKSEVIYNGTNVSFNNLNQKDGLDQLSHPIGVYSGNFEKRKNVDFLFDVYNKHFNISTLLVLGDDPRNKKTLKIYQQKYKNSNIIFLGRVQDVLSYLKKADYLISPSLSEGLPMSVLEGMACDLSLILSNIPQHKELELEKNERIKFFDPKNSISLIKVLAKFFDSWSKDKSGENAKIFNEYFTSERMYNEYSKQYKQLIEEK
ncbi:glycosyltransferase [Limosilactobacillus portuensis]|uniref:glycosyltransferase n=1 Tax=Limosilactobacillus portuensis TaxID=2742601 RepID=UPI003D716581